MSVFAVSGLGGPTIGFFFRAPPNKAPSESLSDESESSVFTTSDFCCLRVTPAAGPAGGWCAGWYPGAGPRPKKRFGAFAEMGVEGTDGVFVEAGLVGVPGVPGVPLPAESLTPALARNRCLT